MLLFKRGLTKPPIYSPKETEALKQAKSSQVDEENKKDYTEQQTPHTSDDPAVKKVMNELEKQDQEQMVSSKDQNLEQLGVDMGIMEAKAEEVISKNRDATQEAHKEVIKEAAKGVEQSQNKIESLLSKSSIPLFEAKTVWPFDFFPSTVTIDINQVNIIHGQFFLSDRRYSISIDNILDCLVDVSPFFGCLRIIDAGFSHNDIEIRYLKRADAMKARRIIQGLIIANKQKLDLITLPNEELLPKIEEIGKITISQN
jgi:hypothetical protein